jgi:TetR/AcrR family transcriptional repressor of nem operon
VRAPSTSTAVRSDTADRILDLAEHLVQTRGFNAFSYADIARQLGVTTASLHYHYPTKVDLGQRLIERYSEVFAAALERIAASDESAGTKLAAYASLYSGVLNEDRMCLCGMLAADYTTLPEPMRSAVTRFFELNERWLAGILAEGREAGDLRFNGDPADVARLLLSTLEGGMLVARTFGDPTRFQAIADRLISDLSAHRDASTN